MLTKIYEQNPSERELQKVVDVLVHDGIVIYPTDSVYAFGCSLHSPKAIERLRRMKGKDAEAFRWSSGIWPRWRSIAVWTTLRSEP